MNGPRAAAQGIAVDHDPFADAPLARVVPTTEPQREVWLACQLGTEASLAYNESVSLHFSGPLDVPALCGAIQDLLDRHDALRATVSADGQSLYLADALVLDVTVVDLGHLEPNAQHVAQGEARSRAVELPFDLEHGPLLRAELLVANLADQLLVLSAHHIVCDGWSFGVLVTELPKFYARRTGQATELLPGADSFADYAVDQLDDAHSSARDADTAYWVSVHDASAPVLELPTDRPRKPVRSFASRRADVTLDAALVVAARKLGAVHGASLFVTLFGLFSALLARLSGSEEVVVGVPAAGQAAEGAASLVGHCVNLLPIRVAIDTEQSLASLLRATHTRVLDAYEHQHCTFGTLLTKLQVTRDPGRLPLVSVLFNLDANIDNEALSVGGLRVELSSNPRHFENFDLYLNASQAAGAIMLECQYNTDLFDRVTIERWLAHFRVALERAVAAPTTLLAELLAPTPAEHEQLAAFNRTARPYDGTLRLSDLVLQAFDNHADRTAVVFEGRSVTYSALAAKAWGIAAALRARGAGPGMLVGVCLERSVEMVASLLGVLFSGAAYVPLDPTLPTARLAGMCEDAGLSLVLSREAELAKAGPAFGAHCQVLLVDGIEPAARLPLLGAIDNPAYVIFTSGSTGRPKGAANAHRGIVNRLQWMQEAYGLQVTDRVLQKTPFTFDVSVWEFFWPLCTGATLVVARPEGHRDAEYLVELIQRERITLMHFVPSMLVFFVAQPGVSNCRSVRRVLCSGEALPYDLVERFFKCLPGVALGNLYGPTEAAVDVTAWECQPHDPAGVVPIGTPIANTAMYVLDSKLRPLPLGVSGDLYIGGVQVGLGYVGRSDLTAERFIADPFRAGGRMYKTGDLGRWRPDGAILYEGRADFQVKVRGYRIELGEIEATLQRHPDIARAVVVAREDEAGDVRLVAYAVSNGSLLVPEVLRDFLRETLPEYMLPQLLVTLKALPLLPNGKIDRESLPIPEAPARTLREFVGPRNDDERMVAMAMEAALSLAGVSVHDDFFALGGHSLLAARLVMSLSEAVRRRVPLRVVFDFPTVAQLAAWLHRSGTANAAAPPLIDACVETGRAPASLMQQRLWFLEQLDPGRLTYNTPSAHRLSGPLDVAALERGFNEMVRRQAVLRTAIVDEAGVPVQHILPTLNVSLQPLEDLSALAAAQREDALMVHMQQRVSQPINMGEAPLFRVGLYRLAEEEHVLFFMPHHVIWDGWSFDLFYEEMAAFYAAYSLGREPALKPLAVSYAGFSHWQSKWLQSDDLKSQLDHWKQRLTDLPEPLDLPLDRPRPARMSGGGGTQPVAWPLELTERARGLGVHHDATLFMTLLAVYAVLLSRLSGQHDIIIGTPVRGRDNPQTEAIMGFFVNALPLRLRIEPGQSFVEVLAQVRSVVLDAFSAPDVPFEHLVRELNVARDESRSPIYQAFFSFQDARQRTRRWGALQQEQIHVFQPGAAEDLGLWFLEHPQGLAGGLSFNADLFEPGTAKRLAERFESLMVAVLADPQQAVGQLACIAADEFALLAEWNRTDAVRGSAPSVAALLAAQAQRTPERVALHSGGASFTYAELEARANCLAHELRARGIARGSLVGLCLDRSVDMLVAQLAILKSGAAYVPLDPAYPADRLTYMAEDAGLALLVTHSSLAGTLPWARERSLWLDADAALLAAQPNAALAPDAQHDAAALDPAYVIYTSGSTGKPKGVVVPHGAVLNFLASMAREPGLVPGDRLLAVTTLSFDIAVLELLLPLSLGAQVVLASREQAQDGQALRALLDASGATVMQATPSTWHMLVEAGWRGGPGFKALVGGEALPVELANALLERCGALWNMYGPTETTVWSTCWKVEAPVQRIFIGRPIANTQVHILDPQGQLCGIGVHGEICIGGEGVSLGYLRRPELTAERFIADPSRPGSHLYRTGDRGRWCIHGLLEHLGRLDFQVKLRGHRIELGEIEANLTGHAQVAQALVMVREDRPGDVRLVAYVVCHTPVPSASELRQHLRLSLPEYMLPQHIVPVDQLPLLPNGKIDRKALPVPTDGPAIAQSALRRNLSSVEQAVAEVWQDLLGVDGVRADDNFFDLGGHSLLAMRVVIEIEKRLGLRVAVRRLIYESLAQIAATPPDALADASKLAPVRSGLLSRVLGRFGPRR